MTTGPETLLAVDRAVKWPESSGVLRRVAGPDFTVPAGETLSWFDPLDGRPEATSELAWGSVSTYATAVEWPEGYPDGLSGAAVGLGDPAAVVLWDVTGEFSVDRGVACVVLSAHVEQVARDHGIQHQPGPRGPGRERDRRGAARRPRPADLGDRVTVVTATTLQDGQEAGQRPGRR